VGKRTVTADLLGTTRRRFLAAGGSAALRLRRRLDGSLSECVVVIIDT
jgi:hypothetical protein